MVGTGILYKCEVPSPECYTTFWMMTIYSDTLHWSGITPILIWTLLPKLTFYLIKRSFHRIFATGTACQQRTLTPPDTWSCPALGFASVLMLREKERRSDSVLWQKLLYQQNIRKTNGQHKNATKNLNTQRLRTDLGRSVGVTTVL